MNIYFPKKVRIGDHLHPNGGIETETEYKKSFDLANHNAKDIRAQPGKIFQSKKNQNFIKPK
jgi:hypothetical protein